ncbi:MAG: CPBP family intramembrane glutamic endopeptidase [Nanoarchaeota archaeon]
MKKYLLILLILCLLLSEIIINVSPVPGFFLYILLITGCLIVLSKEGTLNDYGKLIILFMILPIIRVIELFVNFDYPIKAIVVYLILFFLVLIYSIKFRISLGNMKRGLSFLPLTILLGGALGIAGSWLFGLKGYSELFFILPIIAFSEELLFRGGIQSLIKKNYGIFSSIIFPALLYGIFSLGFGYKIAIFMFLANLLMCFMYNKTENIWVTIPINFFLNLFLFTITIF